MDTQLLAIQIPEGYENVTRKKPESLITFSRIGRTAMSIRQKDPLTYDIFAIFKTLTKSEIDFFITIKEAAYYLTNLATLPSTSIMSKSQKKHQSTNITALVKAGLISRTNRRGCVMINPNVIVPPNDVQEDLLRVWNSYKVQK